MKVWTKKRFVICLCMLLGVAVLGLLKENIGKKLPQEQEQMTQGTLDATPIPSLTEAVEDQEKTASSDELEAKKIEETQELEEKQELDNSDDSEIITVADVTTPLGAQPQPTPTKTSAVSSTPAPTQKPSAGSASTSAEEAKVSAAPTKAAAESTTAAETEKAEKGVYAAEFSNSDNYQQGWYKSWGGAYEKVNGMICTIDKYPIEDETYYVNVNDSRIQVSIQEYDENGKWVKFTSNLKNGASFRKQEATASIALILSSSEWGVKLAELFEAGLQIDLASSVYIDETEIVAFSEFDWTAPEQWISGMYSRTTGKLSLNTGRMSSKYFCVMDASAYQVFLPDSNLRMNIMEMDEDGKILANTDFQSGMRWEKREDTAYVAITLFPAYGEVARQEYLSVITTYGDRLLQVYEPYEHNTVMKKLTASRFIKKMNVGWNLGNSFDSKGGAAGIDANLKQEMNWGNPYITKELIDYVADCGFNTIRIPVSWYYNTGTDEDGNLIVGEKWLSRVQTVVDYAIANDLYVILNTHHEQKMFYAGVSDEEIEEVYRKAEAVWTQIAEYFKTYDEHLMFESYNEIDNLALSWNYSDTAAKQMNRMNQIFVDAVRATGDNNKLRILIVPTLLDGASSKFYDAFVLPKDTAKDRLIVQVHTYTKIFNQDIEPQLELMEEFAERIGTPLIIGEFGTTSSYSPAELRTVQAANYVGRAAAHGIKCIWWDNGSDYAIINRRNLELSDTEMIEALLQGAKGSYCTTPDTVVLNQPDQFIYGMLNLSTGIVEEAYWRSLLLDLDGEALPIGEGDTCTVSLKAINGATGIWLQRIAFYDKDGNAIRWPDVNGAVRHARELRASYYLCEVPEGAVTMRISMNSPTVNVTEEDYTSYLENGDLELSINFFRVEDQALQQTK